MTRSVFVKNTEIAVMDENEPCRKITFLVRLENEDISERAVSVTAEIVDARQRLVTACCKKAFLEGIRKGVRLSKADLSCTRLMGK